MNEEQRAQKNIDFLNTYSTNAQRWEYYSWVQDTQFLYRVNRRTGVIEVAKGSGAFQKSESDLVEFDRQVEHDLLKKLES